MFDFLKGFETLLVWAAIGMYLTAGVAIFAVIKACIWVVTHVTITG